MSQKKNVQRWETGLNDRLSQERRPNGFRKLQNARLQERGNTLQVSRIDGYQQIAGDNTSFDVVYDSIVYDNDLVVYWYNTSSGEVVVTFIDLSGSGTTEKRFAATQADYGELTLLENNIYLTPYDKQLNNIDGTWYLNDFISTTPTFDIDYNIGGSLDPITYYWYKLRFVYFDGHKTITSYPQFVRTSSAGNEAELSNIEVPTDLDGNLCDIEVFRKKEGGDWFLIERVTPSSSPYTYTDDGKVNLQPLDERNYVWSRNPVTQDIVRDRLVRANLEYQRKELGWEQGDVTFSKNTNLGGLDDDRLPKNTQMEIFGQGKFNDGTLSPHKKLGELDIGGEEVTFATDPQTQPSNVDDLKEVAYSAKFQTKEKNEIEFNSLEIYNSNIPSLATKFKSESEQDKPINPHIFLGYKYIKITESIRPDGTNSDKDIDVIDQDWNFDGSNYVGTDDSSSATDDTWGGGSLSDTSIWFNNPTEIIDVNLSGKSSTDLYNNTTIKYKCKYYFLEGSAGGDTNTYLYEMVLVEPLNKAISEGKAKLKLNSVLNEQQLSSNNPNSEYVNNEIDIVGFLDTSVPNQQAIYNNSLTQVYNTGKNHLYIILDSDSIYGDINNESLNNDGVLADYDLPEKPNIEPTLNFSLINIEYVDFDGSTTTEQYTDDNNITQINVDYGLGEFTPIEEDQEELLFLGVQKEFDQDNSTVYTDGYFDGWDFQKENLFEYQTLHEASIFQNLIDDESLQQFQEDYPNQLVWGGSYILESNASGTRDFEFTNFKNISQDYGEIVAISYINNVLLVFCERGVNRVNVGEVLTQQTDSQVFVDSSALLNNDVWILKNVPDIKPRSITQYENMLFFSDGKDVWQFTDGVQNISNGKITLDIDKEFEGTVDPKNKEYQLTNGDETWVYSIELQQWQGPFTYKIETASPYRDNFYGVVRSDSVEFNSGNTFDGSSYDTVIESVANTLDDASVTKLFRKFYIETEGDATFSYGKEYGTWTDKTLSNYPNKNGVYHIGVNPANKNGRQLYWKVTTQEQDFVLQLISFLWQARKRR